MVWRDREIDLTQIFDLPEFHEFPSMAGLAQTACRLNPGRDCAAQPRVRPTRVGQPWEATRRFGTQNGFGRTSIPDVALVNIQTVFREQRAEFCLKCFFSTVFCTILSGLPRSIVLYPELPTKSATLVCAAQRFQRCQKRGRSSLFDVCPPGQIPVGHLFLVTIQLIFSGAAAGAECPLQAQPARSPLLPMGGAER